MQTKIYVIYEGEYSTPLAQLDTWAKLFGLELGKDVNGDFLLSERPKTKGQVTTKEFVESVRFWDRWETIKSEITELNPTCIMVFGKSATEFLSNNTFAKSRGRQSTYKIGEKEFPIFYLGSLRLYEKQGFDKNEELLDTTNKALFLANGMDFKSETQYEIITEKSRFLEILEFCKQTGTFCFDFETTGLDWFREEQKATILSISFQHGYSYILPLLHFDSPFTEEDVLEFFQILEREIFSNPKVNKIAHNLKFDLHWVVKYGCKKFDGRFDDTMIMSHILDENTKNGLKELARKYFIKFTGYEDGVGKYKWDEVPLDLLSRYAALDTDLTLRLRDYFEDLLIEDKLPLKQIQTIRRKLDENGIPLHSVEYLEKLEMMDHRLYILYRNLSMPAFLALFDAEHFGAKLDDKLIYESIEKAEGFLEIKMNELLAFPEVKKFELEQSKEKLKSSIDALTLKLEAQEIKFPGKDTALKRKYKEQLKQLKTGEVNLYEGINFKSVTQLGELLFSDKGFKFPLMYDPFKKEYVRTTKREYLNELHHPFMDKLLAYRSISSMISTYYKGLLERMDVDKKVHTSFLLTGTTSGRLSSRNPNLQNIPARLKFKDDEALWTLKQVKKFFSNLGDDYYMLQYDYSQAELRVIANFSGDPVMTETYKNDYDIHEITAANELSLSLEEFRQLPKDEYKANRNTAKGTNFGLVYDMSIDGYMDYAKNNYGVILTKEQAEVKYKKFFQTYNKLRSWHKVYTEFAKKYGYVRTLFGRKRRLLNIQTADPKTGAYGMDVRAAINSPIQGTSGEYAIFSAAILRQRLPEGTFFFNTVHDSIFFYIKKDMFEYVHPIIVKACEYPPIELYFKIFPGEVKMKMDAEVSEISWGDMKPLDEYFQK